MSSPPLSDDETLTQVQLFNVIPAYVPSPPAEIIKRVLEAARKSGSTSAVLALWTDGTWAVVGYSPDGLTPRPWQLIQAYRSANAAGSRIRLPIYSVGDE